MFKKTPDKVNQDFDIDRSLDFDTPDFAMPGDDSPGKRDPISEFKTGAISGLKSSMRDTEFLRRMVRENLPSGFGDTIDKASTINREVQGLYDDVRKEVTPVLKEGKRLAGRFIKDDSKLVPEFIKKKAREWREEEKSKSSSSVEQQRDMFISSELGKIFAAQAEQESVNEQTRQVQDAAKMKIDERRHSESLDTLNQIRMSADRQDRFQREVSFRVQKKQLELQYRHLFVAQDVLATSRAQMELLKSGMEILVKNTALPDFAKITQYESAKQVFRNKLWSGVHGSLFGDDNSRLGQMFKNARSNIMDRVTGFTSGLSMAMSQADMASEMLDGMEEMISKQQMAGQMVGKWAGQAAGMRVGKWARGKFIDGNKHVNKADLWLRNMLDNGSRKFTDYMDDHERGYEEGPKSWLWKALQIFNTSSLPDVRMGSGSVKQLNQPYIFTRRTDRTINEVMPGYAARTLRELQMLRTGKTDVPLTVFDFGRGVFTTQSSLDRSIRDKILRKRDVEHASRNIEDVIDQIDPNKKLKLEEREALKYSLFQASKRREGTRENLVDRPILSEKHAPHLSAVRTALDSHFNRMDETQTVAFKRRFNSLAANIQDPRATIQEYMDLGYTQELLRAGIIKRNPDDKDEYLFDLERYEQRILSGKIEEDLYGDAEAIPDNRDFAGPPRKTKVKTKVDVTVAAPKVKNKIRVKAPSVDFSQVTAAIQKSSEDAASRIVEAIDRIGATASSDTAPTPNVPPRSFGYKSRIKSKSQDHSATAVFDPYALLDASREKPMYVIVVNGPGDGKKPSFRKPVIPTPIPFIPNVVESMLLPKTYRFGLGANEADGDAWKPKQDFFQSQFDRIADISSTMSTTLHGIHEITKAGFTTTITHNRYNFTGSQQLLRQLEKLKIKGLEDLSPAKLRSLYQRMRKLRKDVPEVADGSDNGQPIFDNSLPGIVSALAYYTGQGIGKGIDRGKKLVQDSGRFVGETWSKHGKKHKDAFVQWWNDDVYDIYLEGEVVPRLTAASIRSGAYFDVGSNLPITNFDSITGRVIDKEGKTIITDEESKRLYAFDPKTRTLRAIRLSQSKVRMAGQYLRDQYDKYKGPAKEFVKSMGRGIASAWNKATGGVYKLIKHALDEPMDIYVAGETQPALTAHRMRLGHYFSTNSGKCVRFPNDIDGPVEDGDRNCLLSAADIAKGLVDKDGLPIQTKMEKLVGMIRNGARRVANWAHQAVDFGKRLLNNSLSTIRRFFGNWSIEFSGRKTVGVLEQIRDFIFAKWGKDMDLAQFSGVKYGMDVDAKIISPKTIADLRDKAQRTLEKASGYLDSAKGFFNKHFGDKEVDGVTQKGRWSKMKDEWQSIKSMTPQERKAYLEGKGTSLKDKIGSKFKGMKTWVDGQKGKKYGKEDIKDAGKYLKDKTLSSGKWLYGFLKKKKEDDVSPELSAAQGTEHNTSMIAAGISRLLSFFKGDENPAINGPVASTPNDTVAVTTPDEPTATTQRRRVKRKDDESNDPVDLKRDATARKRAAINKSRGIETPEPGNSIDLKRDATARKREAMAYSRTRAARAKEDGLSGKNALPGSLTPEQATEINTMSSASTLGKIKDYLKTLLPKKLFGDSNGDGVRDNSAADIRAKRLAEEEKAKKKRDAEASQGKDTKGGKDGGGIFGILSGMASVLGSVLGVVKPIVSLIGTMFGLGLSGGKMYGGALGTTMKWGGKLLWEGAKFTALRAIPWVVAGGAAAAVSVASTAVGLAWGVMAGLASVATGAFMGFLAANPVVWIGALAAGTAYAGYKGYKYLTRNSLSALQTVRYVQYGFRREDPQYAQQVRQFESLITQVVRVSDGSIDIDDSRLKLGEIMGVFGLSETNNDHLASFFAWYQKRFKPVYGAHVAALHNVSNTIKLETVDDLKDVNLKRYFMQTKLLNGPYHVQQLPLVGAGAPSASTVVEVNRAVEWAAKELEIDKIVDKEKDAVDTPEKAKANKAINAVARKIQLDGDNALMEASSLTTDQWSRMAAQGSTVKFVANTQSAMALATEGVKALEAIRFKAYGLAALRVDDVMALQVTEAAMLPYLKLRGKAEVVADVDPSEIFKKVFASYGISMASSVQGRAWRNWFLNRFIPVFTTYVAGYASVTGHVNIGRGMYGLTNEQMLAIGKLIAGLSGAWRVTDSPWPGMFLNTNPAVVDENLEVLKARVKEDKLIEERRTQTDKSQLKSAAPQIPTLDALKAVQTKGPGDPGKGKPLGGSPDAETERRASSGQNSSTGVPDVGTLTLAKGPIGDGRGATGSFILERGVTLNEVNPAFLKLLYGALEEYYRTTGKKAIITSGYRTYEQQEALRREKGNMAAKAGQSPHEFGLAVDINSADLNAMDKLGILRKYGLTRPVGGEPWHLEPAGIQDDMQRAKDSIAYAFSMIPAGVGKGGGGLGSIPNSPNNMRSRDHALKTMASAAREVESPVVSVQAKQVIAATTPIDPLPKPITRPAQTPTPTQSSKQVSAPGPKIRLPNNNTSAVAVAPPHVMQEAEPRPSSDRVTTPKRTVPDATVVNSAAMGLTQPVSRNNVVDRGANRMIPDNVAAELLQVSKMQLERLGSIDDNIRKLVEMSSAPTPTKKSEASPPPVAPSVRLAKPVVSTRSVIEP